MNTHEKKKPLFRRSTTGDATNNTITANNRSAQLRSLRKTSFQKSKQPPPGTQRVTLANEGQLNR